ncbi:alpha/beta-hydrolase [Dothidotthia symphoricarpi CBS 119687]|uniref:Alpha/beta-hydrolase n=1 Tax=Dothidotthia symphoricarpi CBS 119687 TaxID=1392245 RepID=A0A6A6AL72_9PLEO|nr:alpha/beta-hydrolase [Dothidotthia symphoricarpi CBS 119687]KAF2131835.1 alpha/beta-hydrolase [Dothidotthia symphoricarpi CBS 119687]
MSTEEGWHTVEDGQKLYTKTWKTNGPAVARVAFIHGFSDHSKLGTYGEFFPTLASRGIEVYGFDQRGWGRSVTKPSERGHTGPTTRVLDDMTSFLKTLIPSPVPLFLMGHSMGGGETVCYAAQGPAEIRKHIRGYLLESPFIDFTEAGRPSFVTAYVGRLVGYLLPQRQLTNRIDPNQISRDPVANQRCAEDELCHGTGTLEGLSGLMDRTADLAAGNIVIPDDAGEGGVTRLWFGHGTKDLLTDYAATKRFVEALQVKDLEFKTYDGWFHQLHSEPDGDKEIFFDDVGKWILARSTDPVQEGAKPKL